jgi:hypothetical protein
MTKAGEKLLKAARQAVEVVNCDHELTPQPKLNPSTTLDRLYCPKCQATFYQPRPRRPHS